MFILEIQLLSPFGDHFAVQHLITTWSQSTVDSYQLLYHSLQIFAIVSRNLRVLSLQHFLEQSIHVIGFERGLQGCDLIEHTTETPQIALAVIGLVLPDLRTSVVRSACLSVEQTLLGHLGNIQVSKFGLP